MVSEGDRLVELLRSLGATEEDLERVPQHRSSALALELAMRDGRPPLRLTDAAAQIGITPEALTEAWRALGFGRIGEDDRLPAPVVDADRVLARMPELLGEEATLGLLRVLGAAVSRVADAVVDAFRVGVELPELDRGVPYSEFVEGLAAIARVAEPGLEALMAAALRGHLVRVAGSAWIPDFEQAAASRELAIGFADLVGYTALSRTLAPADLAALLRRFEDGATRVVDEAGGRIVKEIGDEVMFVTDSAAAGAATAYGLAEWFAGSDLPPVRVGVAFGSVLTQYGDYYGEVVNLASRLVALARPGTVVVTEAVAAAIRGEWDVEQLPTAALKGFGAPAAVYRLVGPTGSGVGDSAAST